MTQRNGRKPCPNCDYRGTEKTGRYRYVCHGCGNEWTDEKQREKDREEINKRYARRFSWE